MTLVWLSPGLPADRAELAAALPADFALFESPAGASNAASDVSGLAVGSLCVATVFETDLLAQLASRPDGVRLLVIGPEGYQAPAVPFDQRGPDLVTSASSVAGVAAAIQQVPHSYFPAPPFGVAAATGTLDATAADSVGPESAAEKAAPSARRSWLITAGAMIGALGIGAIVIASTEGSSSASATTGRGGFPGAGAGGFGGGNFAGGGGTGAQGGTGARTGIPGLTAGNATQLLACIRKQGFTGSVAQLLQSRNDPQLQQAFLTCVQQLRGTGATTSSFITGRP